MGCSCNSELVGLSPSGEVLPLILADQSISSPPVAVACCSDKDAEVSCEAGAASVPSTFLETCCENEGVILIARKGSYFSRFTGNGFIQLINGKAKVVRSLILQISTLWHERFKVPGKGTPTLGAPLSAPYNVIADGDGNLHALKGDSDEDSVLMWDASLQSHITIPVSAMPRQQTGLLPQSTQLEIMGIPPIPADGSSSDIRNISTLGAPGIVIVRPRATIPGDSCQLSAETAYVAQSLAPPTGEGVYTLKFTLADGYYWSED